MRIISEKEIRSLVAEAAKLKNYAISDYTRSYVLAKKGRNEATVAVNKMILNGSPIFWLHVVYSPEFSEESFCEQTEEALAAKVKEIAVAILKEGFVSA